MVFCACAEVPFAGSPASGARFFFSLYHLMNHQSRLRQAQLILLRARSSDKSHGPQPSLGNIPTFRWMYASTFVSACRASLDVHDSNNSFSRLFSSHLPRVSQATQPVALAPESAAAWASMKNGGTQFSNFFFLNSLGSGSSISVSVTFFSFHSV